jgi:hypothetical protein
MIELDDLRDRADVHDLLVRVVHRTHEHSWCDGDPEVAERPPAPEAAS